MIGVIRVRKGHPNPMIRKTLELLRLDKVNTLSLIQDNPQMKGMLIICQDYVTWGIISDELVTKVEEKKGKVETPIKFFHLRPPSKGYESLKLPYPKGSMGKRESLDELVKRMI